MRSKNAYLANERMKNESTQIVLEESIAVIFHRSVGKDVSSNFNETLIARRQMERYLCLHETNNRLLWRLPGPCNRGICGREDRQNRNPAERPVPYSDRATFEPRRNARRSQ